MGNETWKVGELSRLTGLTIRTLHHYDEIGLLTPSSHTEAGHRIYSEMDIIKLQQIMSLKQLGFSLDEIKRVFEDPNYNPRDIINFQISKLNEEIKIKEELRNQLEELREVFGNWSTPGTDQFIKAIQLLINQNKYFTEEQRIKLKGQYNKFALNHEGNSMMDWKELLTAFQVELDKGTLSDTPCVKELARIWKKEIDLYTKGDMEIVRSAERFYMDNPYAAKSSGMTKELYEYINKALASLGK